MKIVLSKDEVRDAVGAYLSLRLSDVRKENMKVLIRRQSSKSDEVGSVVVDIKEGR